MAEIKDTEIDIQDIEIYLDGEPTWYDGDALHYNTLDGLELMKEFVKFVNKSGSIRKSIKRLEIANSLRK